MDQRKKCATRFSNRHASARTSLWREQLQNRIAAATTDYLAGGNHMQIKQTNAAIYASLILILTFELSFSQSILANLAVFMGCVIFFNMASENSRLLLWIIFLSHFLPAIGTFWSIYLHGTSSQQAWLLFSRTYAFAGLGLAFAVGVDFEELLLLLEQKGLAPNFVYGIFSGGSRLTGSEKRN